MVSNPQTLPTLARWGELAAMGAGVLWISTYLGEFLSPDPDYWDCNSSYDYLLNVGASAQFLVLLGGLVGIHARQKAHYGNLGTWGFFAALGGAAMAGVANPFEHCLGLGFLGLAWLLGVLAMSVGCLLVGIATIRAKVLPSWCGWVLIIGSLGLWLLAENGSAVLFGVAWVAVGYALWSDGSSSVQQPARVR